MKIIETGNRIELHNGKLTISFNLSAERGPLNKGDKGFYAGSAISVRYKNERDTDMEMLDLYRHYLSKFAWLGHDPEKRGLQVDKLILHEPGYDNGAEAEVSVFDHDYSCREIICDETECSILVQCPIVCPRPGLQASSQPNPTHYLQRKLSLNKDANYVLEELSVSRANAEGSPIDSGDKVELTAKYFMLMDFGWVPGIKENLSEGRFLVASAQEQDFFPNMPLPRFAYGFSTSSGITNLSNPVSGFPDPNKAHKSFSWQISRSRNLKLLHLFAFGQEIDSAFDRLQQLQSLEFSGDAKDE